MVDTRNDSGNSPEDRIRRMTKDQQKNAFSRSYSASSRERSEDFETLRQFGDSALRAWDWTHIPLSKIYQMRSDPMIQFGLLFIKVPLIRAPWYIECEDPQVSAFVESALREIWTSFVYEYTNCYDFGYAPIVKEFKRTIPDWTFLDPEHPEEPKQPVWDEGNVEAIVWNTFTQIAPEHAKVEWTKSGEFNGFKWTSPGKPIGTFSDDGSVHVPITHALWATNAKEKVFGSLFGESMLVPVYRYWWSYWFRWALADRAFEKNVDPAVIVYYPPGDNFEDEDGNTLDQKSVGLDLFDLARSGATIALPNAREVDENGRSTSRMWEWEQLKLDSNFSALQDTFNYLDVMKLRSLCVPEQALIEGAGGQSSRNVAAALGDKFFESQYVRMQEIDQHVNKYMIPQLVAINFPEFKGSIRKVTRGFASIDIDLAKQIFQLIAQGNPDALAMVNLRDMLAQYDIPLMDANTLARQTADQAAAEQAALAASVTANTAGMPDAGAEGTKPVPTAPGDTSAGGSITNSVPKKKVTQNAPVGGGVPPTRGVLKAGALTSTSVTFSDPEPPKEPFLARMREMYPPMEDDRYALPADELREAWEGAYRRGYLAIRDDVLAGVELDEIIEPDILLGPAAVSTRVMAAIMAQLGIEYAGVEDTTKKILIHLMAQAGADAAIKLGHLPSAVGNDFADASKWAAANAAGLAHGVATTTAAEIATFLRASKATTKAELAAEYDQHFFAESNFPEWKAERLARGESVQAYRMGQLLAAKSLGAEMVRASDASHGTNFETDQMCIDRHGREYTIEEAVQETLHGTHPRCTLSWSPIPAPHKLLAAEEAEDEDDTPTEPTSEPRPSLFRRWFGKKDDDDPEPAS